MDNIQRIMVRTEEGTEVEANVVTFIKDNESGKEYVLYTVDETIEEDIEVYASIFKENENGYELLPIESDEEWKLIQEEISRLAEE